MASSRPVAGAAAGAAGASQDTASALRTQGNEAFSRGQYAEAVEAYSQALRLSPGTPELWSNRAACYLKLDQPYLAAADAYELLEIRPDWPKSYFRLGKASVAMGGYSDALEWYDAGLTCANMLGLANEAKTLEKCIRQAQRAKKAGGKADLHAKLAKEMNFDSELFYVPRTTAKSRALSVASNPSFFSTLVEPFPVCIVDIDQPSGEISELVTADGAGAAATTTASNVVATPAAHWHEEAPGGGRGLVATKTFDTHSVAFLDEQIICVSYSPYLCDHCGAALPPPRHAYHADKKEGESFETYCSKDCLDIARECYHGPSLSADAARAIAALRKQLYAATESGEAPLASSYHVLGAMRLAAMHLARRWYMAKGKTVPRRLQRKLDAFDKLVRPADLPATILEDHGFKVPFQERYRQYQRIVAALNLVRDPDISFEWYDGAWGSMLFNALRTTADGGADDEAAGRVLDDPQGRRSESVSIMAIGSYINHSFEPNVTVRRSKVGAPFPTHIFQFVSIRPIGKDEELFLSYTDPALPLDVQRGVLQGQYLIGTGDAKPEVPTSEKNTPDSTPDSKEMADASSTVLEVGEAPTSSGGEAKTSTTKHSTPVLAQTSDADRQLHKSAPSSAAKRKPSGQMSSTANQPDHIRHPGGTTFTANGKTVSASGNNGISEAKRRQQQLEAAIRQPSVPVSSLPNSDSGKPLVDDVRLFNCGSLADDLD